MSAIDPGEGYRLLEYGEIILPTDEYSWHGNKWMIMHGQMVSGKPYTEGIAPTRRKINKSRKPKQKKLIAIDGMKAEWRLA